MQPGTFVFSPIDLHYIVIVGALVRYTNNVYLYLGTHVFNTRINNIYLIANSRMQTIYPKRNIPYLNNILTNIHIQMPVRFEKGYEIHQVSHQFMHTSKPGIKSLTKCHFKHFRS